MRILIVEDDEKISSFVAKSLRQSAHVIDVATDGDAALELALSVSYDAIVLDLLLPKRNGFEVITELRRRSVATPVLVLSARQSVGDKVRALRAGGDDYLTKPFSLAELAARLDALVRRSQGAARPEQTQLAYADVSLDRLTRRVHRRGARVDLQPKEFALLEYLLANAGRVMTKALILQHVWDCSFDPQTNVVDVLVCRLRTKLDRDFEPRLIHTLRGVGYVLRAD